MWKFHLNTKVEFGKGCSGSLGERLPLFGSRPLFVTDGFLVKMDFVINLIGMVSPVAVFSGVRPDPAIDNVNELADIIRKSGADVLVAVGGGSSMDCAKAAACLAVTGEKSLRIFHSGGQVFKEAGIPLIVLPTTAGTGSEVTPFAVFEDAERKIKGPIASDYFYPEMALVDPELTYTLPQKVTAITALDALSHAIEGYWSKNHQPICDLFAKDAAKRIFANLEKVLENLSDEKGREELSYAALLAGMAFQLPKNAIVHACSFPLSNRYHMPHGAACAFTLEAAIRLNAPFMENRMDEFSSYCGFKSIAEMTAKIRRFKETGGLPLNLKEAGIPEEQIELLIEESFHPLMNNNPKTVTRDDLWKIYSELGE
jgi:alcohol dehydrogenase